MFKYLLHIFVLLFLVSCGKGNQLSEVRPFTSISNEQAEMIDLKVVSLSHRKNKIDRHIIETLVKSATFEKNDQLRERNELLERDGKYQLLFDFLDEVPNYLDFKIEFNRKLSDESFSLIALDKSHETILIDKNITLFHLEGELYRLVYRLSEEYKGMRIFLKSDSLSFNKEIMGNIEKKENEKILPLGSNLPLQGNSLIQFESSSDELSFILPFYMLNQTFKKIIHFSERSEIKLGRVCQQNRMKLYVSALYEKLPIFQVSKSEVVLSNGFTETKERVESRNRQFLGYKKENIENFLKDFIFVDMKGNSLSVTSLHRESELYSFDHPFFASCPSVKLKLRKSSWIENVELGTVWTKGNRIDLKTGLLSDVAFRNFVVISSGLVKREIISVEHEKSLYGHVELY